MTKATKIHGICATGYEPVRDISLGHFELGLEVGASVAVARDGEPVVGLWAGDARRDPRLEGMATHDPSPA